jgi:tetratricopeptide (TPR) repeat protein/tRNA A-37 threonylcarbamoyl transferase component Bud32
MAAIPLGPFVLTRPIGKGGMGEVWRGRHADQDVTVAVKVMTAKVFAKPENRTRFNNEVRAVAQLDHPGIVWVFDYGVVPEEAAEASGGRLVAGSPYLAMEHAGSGTLASLRRPLPWHEQRTVLLNLLDALAHAHAHGIVHRDLKPANVLICGARDMRPGVKLTDFGIASAEVNEPAQKEEVVGTLHYMSPEQIRGAAWAQGPHTDLYGLGCLAWRLACGGVPFAGRSGVRLLAAQLHQPLPPIEPIHPVPEGYQDWLAAITAKDPANRFRRAADAAEALVDLGEPGGRHTPPPVYRVRRPDAGTTGFPRGRPRLVEEENTAVQTDTRFLEEQVTVLSLPRMKGQPVRDEHHALAQLRAALPIDWRRVDTQRRSIRLLGAGLGLFGVRTVPMVGREEERDTLWRALRQVHSTRSAQAVVLRGAAGAGKSRLAEWLSRRAHEVGAAQPLMARFQETGASGQGLQRMLTRSLRMRHDDALDDEMTTSWLAWWQTESDAVRSALHTLVPGREGLDRTTRHAMLRLLLEQMCRERPIVVWLDDVQWGLDGIRLASSLLDVQTLRPHPILLVLTVRDEALVTRDQERTELEALLAHDRCDAMQVAPLSRPEQARLVQELLGLEPSLGAAVEERAAGNPLFAVQLVGDWVQRGLLVHGDAGFELAEGASARLPDDLTEVWSERIERLLAGLPRDARWILERAGVIGPDVDSKEWRQVCDGSELIPRNEVIRRALLERLLQSRLANESDAGWVFAHGLLHETLQAEARRAGRWQEANRAAAWMLQGRPGDPNHERVGLYLLEAGEIEAAIEPLLLGAAHRRVAVGRRSALRLIRRCEDAMAGRVPRQDRRWGALLLEKATLLDLLGRPEGYPLAREVLETAKRHGWTAIEGRTALQLGHMARKFGDVDAAREWNLRALTCLRDPRLRAEADFELARIARMQVDLPTAHRYEAEAFDLLASTRDADAQMTADAYRAEAAWYDQDWDVCATMARRVLDRTPDLGVRSRMWNLVAESARQTGDLPAAVAALDEAIELTDLIGHGSSSPILRANLALIHLSRDDYARADQVLHDALYTARLANLPPLMGSLHALLMTSSAGTGAWAAFDDHASVAEAIQEGLPVGEKDCAVALEKASRLCRASGFPRRAQRAATLAADHWRKLGDDDRATAAAALG